MFHTSGFALGRRTTSSGWRSRSGIVARYVEGVFAVAIRHNDISALQHVFMPQCRACPKNQHYFAEKSKVLAIKKGIRRENHMSAC